MERVFSDGVTITVTAECDLPIRRGRFQLYAIVTERGDNVVMRFTDFRQTVEIMASVNAADSLATCLRNAVAAKQS